MSDIIDFLERMGRDPDLRYGSSATIEHAMREAHISPELRAILARGDQASLEGLLGAATNVCCMVHAPLREEEPAKEKEDGKPVAIHAPTGRIA